MSGVNLRAALGAIRRGALVTVVFGLPLVFLWDVANLPFETPKLALLVLCTSVAAAARIGETLLGATAEGLRRAALPAALAVVPAGIAWLATEYKAWSLIGSYGRFGGLVPIALVAVAGVLLADAFAGRFRVPAWALTWSAAGVALYTILQSAGLDPAGIPVVEYVTSTVGHSNYIGGFLAIALPVCLALWTTSAGAARYAAMGISTVTTLAIVLSFSQGGWIATAAGVAVFAGGVAGGKHRLAPAAGWFAGAAIAAVSVGVVLLSLVDPFNPLVPDTGRARGLWWRSAVSMGVESPVWGHGPETFAIVGRHHRGAEDALAHDRTYADQPHSVPLAHFANHGLIGVAGFVLLVAWVVRRGWHAAGDPMRGAFAAGGVAYVAQSLVSLDVTVLTLPFWVCVAGLAQGGPGDPPPPDPPPSEDRGVLRPAIASVLVLATAALATWWGVRFIAVDTGVRRGLDAFGDRRTELAIERFEDVLRRRPSEAYRHVYGTVLAAAALRERKDGDDEIARLKEVYGFLDGFPEVRMLTSYADGLHQWSIFDPSLEAEAYAQLERALELDEFSPTLRVLAAEALLRLDRVDEAVATLEHMLPALREHDEYVHNQPPLLGALSIAYFHAGRSAEAQDALDRALEVHASGADDCHVLVAGELLARDGEPATRDELRESSPGLLLCRPATLALLPGWDPAAED